MTYFFLLWYLPAFLTCMYFIYSTDNRVYVYDIFIAFILAMFGPFLVVYSMCGMIAKSDRPSCKYVTSITKRSAKGIASFWNSEIFKGGK